MNESQILGAAEALYGAWQTRSVIEPLTEQYPQMSIEDAYGIQQAFIAQRLQKGERVIGKKIGVTSKAVMDMLKVYQPDFGYLLDGMRVSSSSRVSMDGLIQPKAEGELAFVLKKDLLGPGVTNADVLAATEGVMACFEIVDSRIRDWRIRIQDTVADNASCGLFVLGDRLVAPSEVDFCLCGMVLEKNGEVLVTGAGAAALGSPVNAVAWLANTLGHFGIPLKAGEVILSGALGAMVPVARGDSLRLAIGGVGQCTVLFN
ncbi:2-oxopent-4-enoate hydratase [Pseudomonas sp.]|uniref:2-oxopent-4-enoate hydratase n=1 Tax=Pseudomonas sp. TaxID=306 RepID=UPI0031B6363A